MGGSRYYAWAVFDVEDWSSRPAVNGARIQRVLSQIVTQSLGSVDIDTAHVAWQRRGDGALLALPGNIAKEVITTEFVAVLREGISEHDANCPPEDSIRLRLALHAGEALEGEGEWAGRPVITACRLVDSSVLRRVLAASTGSPLAVIVSSDWYDAVVREGYASADGYRKVWVEVKNFADTAWVKVPGRSSPPGLIPEDDATRPRIDGDSAVSSSPGRRDADGSGSHGDTTVYGNAITGGTFQGDVVFGDKHSYGPDRRDWAGGR